jgi:glycosyltransferase involved in cell wall biosynthesis
MRLLILNWRDLKHPRAGGSETYAQSLAREWASDGHDVTLFCAAAPGLVASERVDAYDIVRDGSRTTVYRRARAFWRRAPTFDAVLEVVNTRPFLTPRWLRGVPVVTLIYQVAREVWRYEVPWPAALLGRHVLEPRWLAAYRDAPVLTISQTSRDSLREYGLRNVAIVHAGIDPPLDRPRPERAATPTWLIVGRLSANKRPDHALEAHRRLVRALPEAQLWVVGEGPMAQRLRRRAGAGVTFFGRVDAGVKQDLMASAHAVIGTGVREGWGLTISEAARLGTRAIAYDVPGLRDSVPAAGGELVAPRPQALADAGARLLPRWRAEGPADLGDAGVRAWSEVADEVMAHVEAALAARRAPLPGVAG